MNRLASVALCLLVPAQLAAQSAAAPSIARAAAAHPQPGDRIVVHMVGEPLLSDTVMVTERGDAPFAKLGVIRVSDYSTAALQDTLQARYATFIRTPALELIVLRRIGVQGEVAKPNVYFADVATTLRELVARAGGTTENANRDKLWIIRNGERIDIPNWQSDQSVTSDLRSGDQLVVGRKSWLSLNLLPAVSAAGVVASIILALTR